MNSSRVNYQSQKQQQVLSTKSSLKETKSDWKSTTKSDWKNSTQNNWGIQTKSDWKKETNSNWKNSNVKNNTKSNWKENYQKTNDIQVVGEKLQENPPVTLDQVFGQGFKSVQLNDTAPQEFEGSEPLRNEIEQYYIDEDFEINETDEDMYSESNTHSRFDLDSQTQRNSKRKQRSRKTYREKSVEPLNISHTVILDADQKIKQKIIDKYSKNQKQKSFIHPQMLSFNKTENFLDQKIKNTSILDLSYRNDNNSLSETQSKQTVCASPAQSNKNNTSKEYKQRIQCNSQSPQRTQLEIAKNNLELQLRNSQSNFYYNEKHYDDSKSMENHIAFRNSFYNSNNKYVDLQQQLYDMPTSIYKNLNNTIKKPSIQIEDEQLILRQNRHKEELKEIKNRDEEFYDKYTQKFNINKQELQSQQNKGHNHKRMQTPNHQFRSDLLKDKA